MLLAIATATLGLTAVASAQDARCPEGTAGHCGWKYEPVLNTQCRLDTKRAGRGDQAGVAVRKSKTASDTLMITIQGGGACTNLATCLGGANSFDEADFNKATDPANSDPVTHLLAGIWDRSDVNSKVAQFHQVYIPYCSGDLHVGDRVRSDFPVLGTTSYFKGFSNTKAFFDFIVKTTIPSINAAQPGNPIKHVVLGGFSAGGFGAVLNLNQFTSSVSAAGLGVKVTLINDSAPFFNNVDPASPKGRLFAPCLQKSIHDRFNLASTVMKQCRACTPTNWMEAFQDEVLAANPRVDYGFVSSTDDGVIRTFLSPVAFFDCDGQIPSTHETEYLKGLKDIRAKLQSSRVETTARHTATYFESYNGSDDLLGSTKHVFIHNGSPTSKGGYFYPYVGTTSVKTWLEGFLANSAGPLSSRHVGNCSTWNGGITYDCK
jgi:hypothetical protein